MIRLSLVVPVALAVTATACSSPPEPTAEQAAPVPVMTAAVEVSEWPSFFEAGGTLGSRLTAVVSSRVLAPVRSVRVRAGDRVSRGQVLIELDAAEQEARATGAAAGVEAARFAAEAARADEDGAGAALELARQTHARVRTLHEQRSATEQELDQAVAALASAEARSAAAHAAAAGASAALEAARAAAAAGRIAAGYGALTAPYDGIVTRRDVDPGAMAAPGVPLLVIEDPSALRLEVDLDAARAGRVSLGTGVDVRIDSDGPDAPWADGRVAEIARVDPDSQSFRVKIDVPSSPAWRSGLFGRARFRGSLRNALTIPSGALLRRGQLELVFVVSGEEIARLRAVRAGTAVDGRIEILAGLAAGDVVVVDPSAALVDGQRVTGR